MTTKIYGYFEERLGKMGRAIARIEDGTIIASHWCPEELFASSTLGMSGTGCYKHYLYDKSFPEGYDLLFLYGGEHAFIQATKGGH